WSRLMMETVEESPKSTTNPAKCWLNFHNWLSPQTTSWSIKTKAVQHLLQHTLITAASGTWEDSSELGNTLRSRSLDALAGGCFCLRGLEAGRAGRAFMVLGKEGRVLLSSCWRRRGS
uniref:Uncharacterized protein n=1 Tax=Nothoprocta perdicaria TaxID=30464 RepID=A0A8C6Z8Y9_NOTPE